MAAKRTTITITRCTRPKHQNLLRLSPKKECLPPLPEAGDIEGQAAFWKQHYNTPFGVGTVSKYAYKVPKALKEAFAH